FCFFFSSRRRHTRSDRDWSSDVCSSDLWRQPGSRSSRRLCGAWERRLCSPPVPAETTAGGPPHGGETRKAAFASAPSASSAGRKIGRASCRERVKIEEGGVAEKRNRE